MKIINLMNIILSKEAEYKNIAVSLHLKKVQKQANQRLHLDMDDLYLKCQRTRQGGVLVWRPKIRELMFY